MLIDMRSMYIHKLEKGALGTVVFKEIPAGGAVVVKVRPYDEALGTMIHKESKTGAETTGATFEHDPRTTAVAGSTAYLTAEQKQRAEASQK